MNREISNSISTANALMRMERIVEIKDFINKHPDEYGKNAKKAYNVYITITLLLIFLVVMPLMFLGIIGIMTTRTYDKYPVGAVRSVNGSIGLYSDTFWYTDSSHKYEYNFEDYGINIDDYKRGEDIVIFLDSNNNVVSIDHEKGTSKIILSFCMILVFPLVILLCNFILGKKTYGREWFLYVKWYEKEILPYRYQEDFEDIVANKHYYDVMLNYNDIDADSKRLYKSYLIKDIICHLMLMLLIILVPCYADKISLSNFAKPMSIIFIIYTFGFSGLIVHFENKMNEIKCGYIKKEDR